MPSGPAGYVSGRETAHVKPAQMDAVTVCRITLSKNQITTMTSVPRLINFWESMSKGEVLVTATVLPEMIHKAGSQTPLAGASPQSLSPQLPINGRQPCEPCVSGSLVPGGSCVNQSRARSDDALAYEHWIDETLHCHDRGCTTRRDWYMANGSLPMFDISYPNQKGGIKRNKYDDGAFRDFPYRGAHAFRDRLISKRISYDPDWVIEEVLARLGPEEGDGPPEITELKETDLMSDLTCDNPAIASNNPYTVLPRDDGGCMLSQALAGRAKQLVKWFKGFDLPLIRDLPASIECGGLRNAVRQCFSDVDPVWELSFKTVQKIERSCCRYCLPSFQSKLSQWKEDRSRQQPVDSSHLSRFREAFRANVDKGWDRRRRPFIPNGNATRRFKRKDGGNWNVEEFSTGFRTELVFSSGKPRVVTVYSSENTRILAPMHYSLYDSLKRKGWLLVGDPTERHISRLNGAALLSFDYSAATDNIKTEYVRSAIDILIEQAESISDEELRALKVLGNLSLEGVECGSGQPMGSVMSFPLLCLINKTVVDLALNSLLVGKKISFHEWSGHRLLINGDDLLTKEVRTDTDLRGQIIVQGSEVGLVVNQEKTMVSDVLCEINSTLFSNGRRVRKFNASAVWMDPGVEDVLGFAAQASPDVKTFRKVVRWNSNILAKSKDKHLAEIPPHLQVVCRKDKKIRRALTSQPKSERSRQLGVIRMAPVPDGYDLDVSDEHRAMREEIERVREKGVAWAKARATRKQFRTIAIPNSTSYSQVLKQRRGAEQELIPACYVRTYVNKMRDALVEEYVAGSSSEMLPPGDGPRISVLIDNLRLFNQQKVAVRTSGTTFPTGDFVSFD